LITDAPVDNNGQGRSFSPTDLCAMSLGACALTIMGIFAQNHWLDIDGTTFAVTKTMSADAPRRIAKVEVVFSFPDKGYTDKDKKSLERAALTCPVHHSLGPDVEQVITFSW
ncbi:MAG: OsmC family protein, partial [Planctomycetes bacterium]|nr:OsmC family protein [Planctomycetota bacterium]